MPANAPFGHCPKCLLDLGFGLLPDKTADSSSAESGASRAFGEYELIEQIGRGGMGVVYKARQVALNRPVALKMISAGEFASPVVIQRFHREAEAAANLHHPNIIPIYETGEIHGQHYLSMALIDGVGLDEYIKRAGGEVSLPGKSARAVSRMRQEEIARLLAKVARAVDHAHQHGVLHRDLKPGNILVDPNGEPHLTDFGLAKVLGRGDSSLTVTGAIMGTPSFMAPEQASGGGKSTSTAADVYSLGAILYTMLTGVPPFRGDTPVETLRQVVEQEPKPPSTLREGIDSDLATIAMKCLEKEPQRRYSSAAALAEDLERWSRKEPIQARSINTTERFWRWCRRNPRVAALGVSVALLLITLAAGSTFVALRIKSLSDSVENNNRQLRNEVLDNLVKLYADPNTTNYTIRAQVRHAFVGRVRAKPVSGTSLELTAIEYVYEHPTNVLTVYSPILQMLEDNLSDRLQRPVLIHLRMLQSYDLGYDALESEPLTFGRVGPASYSHLLDKGTGVRLLAMQDHKNPLTVALFTSTNSSLAHTLEARPVIKLAELSLNQSMAFGNLNSTTGNYLARWLLANNGVFATNLSRFAHFKNPRAVIDEVRSGRYDMGAANRDVVDNYPDLKIIAKFEISDLGRCFVAGKGLDDQVFQRLRECLLQMRDPAVIGGLESEVVGFKLIDDQALDRLREIMRGAAAFDSVGRKE